MTTLTSFQVTDDLTDNTAAKHNRLLGSILRSEFGNAENLSGTRTLLDADTPIQRLNCNGADRIVKMPTANTTENHLFFIVNSTSSGTYTLTVQNNGATVTYAALNPSEYILMIPDGNGGYLPVNHSFWNVVSPSQITANQNNYNPTGASSAHVLRLSTDAARDVTGFAFPAANKTILVHNVGSYNLVLKDESASSTAANRFALNADVTLGADQSVMLWYDTTSSRWRLVGGAGGSLTNSVSSVTSANVTGVAGTRHILDVSGMTANRNFILLAGAAGQEIEVNLSVGDDTYALILKGDTGISINGGSAATEWSRLFITNETVRFVATSSSNWNVINDGRIPCIAVLERQAAQSIANTTATKIAFDAAPTNRGNMGDIATNDRVNIRRSNFYVVSGFASIGAVLDNQEFLEAELYKNGSLFKFKRDYVATASSNLFSSPEVTARGTYSAGDYFELYIYHNEGASQNTDTTYYPTLAVIEQL